MDSNSNIKILVTGARGFIGARVSAYLLACGFDVCGLSRGDVDDDPRLRGEGNLKYIQGNFGDGDRMAEVLSSVRPDVIIHCAGVTPHGDVDADDYHRVNVEGGRNFIEAITDPSLRGEGKKAVFINASTIGVYGQPLSDDGVVREGDVCAPLSPYAQSKYDFEQVLSESDVAHINLRIANIPGRDAFINYVLNHGRVQFNGDVPYVRDYIHLDDLAKLFEKSIHYLLNGGGNLTVNAGASVGFSFPDIVDEIENQTSVEVARSTADAKTGDVVKILCDISIANHELGWKPDHIDLKDIIDYALRNKTL